MPIEKRKTKENNIQVPDKKNISAINTQNCSQEHLLMIT